MISDGGDNASKQSLRSVLQGANRSDAIIYTIGLFDEYDTDRNPRVPKQIARATGGEAFFPQQTSAVVKICEGIAEEIRHQYTIGYSPANETLDGSYRTIKLAIAKPHESKLLVRTRTGYIASPDRNAVGTEFDKGVR